MEEHPSRSPSRNQTAPQICGTELGLRVLGPLGHPHPAGVPALCDWRFERIEQVVSALSSPFAEPVDWNEILELCTDLLENKTKDIRLVCYATVAAYERDGPNALNEWLLILEGFLQQWWDSCFPPQDRLRARTNALDWVAGRLESRLADLDPSQVDQCALRTLETRWAALTRIVDRWSLQVLSPALSLVSARLRSLLAANQSLPAQPSEVDPTPPTPRDSRAQKSPSLSSPAHGGRSLPESNQRQTVSACQPSWSDSPDVPATTHAQQVNDFLPKISRSLVQAANQLRLSNTQDATAYRLLRIGLWLHLIFPPVCDASGKTQLVPLPKERRKQLTQLERSGAWEALLDEAESGMNQFRLSLDLNWWVHRSLDALGPAYHSAAQAVLTETRHLIARMPQLLKLRASDDHPLANERTVAWLRSATPPPNPPPTVDPRPTKRPHRQRLEEFFAGGDIAQAIAAGQELVENAQSKRERVRCQLELAQHCQNAGENRLAAGLFAAVDRQLQELTAWVWEPALARACLIGLIESTRDANADISVVEHQRFFERLCSIDAAAAARLSSPQVV